MSGHNAQSGLVLTCSHAKHRDGLACPTQVQPEMPRKALQDGIEGVVKVQIHIKGGNLVEVSILCGPRVFHAAVKAAMMQYKCVTDAGDVIAAQEFNFKVE